MRKTVLWEKIVADIGLSFNELDSLTIDTLVASSWMNIKYRNLSIFLTTIAEPLAAAYSEALDAEALWSITETQKQYSRIVVIAGWAHLHNLEKYLDRLGFLRSQTHGRDYTSAYETYEKSDRRLKNCIDMHHSLRIAPLDPLDWFGQYLFDNAIKTAQQQFETVPETARSKEQIDALNASDVTMNALSIFKPVPFVPYETFTWISQAQN